MKSIVAAAAVVLVLSGVSAPAQGTQPTATRYANCTELLKVYSAGIAKSKKARNQAVREGFKRPKVSTALYDLNGSRLDRDKDGVMCEQKA